MERNVTLDYFKVFLSILVITIHFRFPIENKFVFFYSDMVSDGIAKIAVPCFFILNGYFLQINSFQKVKKYIIRIFILYIIWSFFYLPSWDSYTFKYFSLFTILGYYHLWYLPALIGAVVIAYPLMKKIRNRFSLLLIAFILYFTGYIIQHIFNLSFFYLFVVRNFLFVGFPFFTLGFLIRSSPGKIFNQINIYVITLCFILFFVEKIFFSGFCEIQDLYLSLFIVVPILFLFVLKHSKYSTQFTNVNNLSSAIYFIHPFIILIANTLYISNIYLLPFIILFSILFSFLIIYVNKSLKIFL